MRERRSLRARILGAARELLDTEGYDAVTIWRVGDKIEYTPPVIYQHFTDKGALIRELYGAEWGRLQAGLEALAAVSDHLERLVRMGTAYVDFWLARPNYFRMMLTQPQNVRAGAGRGAVGVDGDGWGAKAFQVLRGTVDEVCRTGRFAPDSCDPAAIAHILWESLHGIAAVHVTYGRHCDRAEYRDPRETVRLCLATLMCGLTRGGPR